VKPHHVLALRHIALIGGSEGYVSLSTGELGEALGLSQQAASHRILELIEMGVVQRDLAARQQRVRLTSQGVDILRSEYATYRRIFEVGRTLRIAGVVTSGLGEGAFYMRQRGYQDQFRKQLGFEPYAGTLNVRLHAPELAKLEVLRQEPGIPIEGFASDGRTWGGAKCFPATLNSVACAVILPLRTHHSDMLEVIAKLYLRDAVGLKDGDRIELSVAL